MVAPAAPIRVAVVIVSWNTRELLLRAVRSAYAVGQELDLRVIVVDNASTDGSGDAVATAFPAVQIIRNQHNVGFGRANNQAFERIEEPFALLLNSDAELIPGCLQALVQDLVDHPNVGATGARLQYPDGRFQASFADFPSLQRDLLALAGLSRTLFGPSYPSYPEVASRAPRDVDWVGGACLLARQAALAEVGGFDPDFEMYAEETDLCRRMTNAGWAIRYCPTALATHFGGQSTKQRSLEQPRLYWRSQVLYYRKHRPRWQSLVLASAVRLAYAGRSVVWAILGALRHGSRRADSWHRARAALRLAADGRL